MAKYDPLRNHLREVGGDVVEVTFEDLAELVSGLPPSALEHRAWWANGSTVRAQSWRAAGFYVSQISRDSGRVRFERGEPGGAS